MRVEGGTIKRKRKSAVLRKQHVPSLGRKEHLAPLRN